MAIDASGNVYITGYCIRAQPIIPYREVWSGRNMLWSRMHTSGDYEVATALAVDSAGNTLCCRLFIQWNK